MDAPYLSVVVPVKNAEGHIRQSLHRIFTYLDKQDYASEVIVVDGGSVDATTETVKGFGEGHANLRLLDGGAGGKGHCVRLGLLEGRGKVLLYAEGNPSLPTEETSRFLEAIGSGCELAVGIRRGAGKSLNAIARLIAPVGVRDVFCGFKMFTRKAAHGIFSLQHFPDDSFDLEALYLAKKFGYRISAISLPPDALQDSQRPGATGLIKTALLIRIRALIGRYNRSDPDAKNSPEDLIGCCWSDMLQSENYDRWIEHPLMYEEWLNRIFSEHGATDLYDWIERRIREANPKTILVPCCGDGFTERSLTQRGIQANFIGMDITPKAVERARRKAKPYPNITYKVADINKVKLTKHSLDLCLASSALHHVEGLEHFLDQVSNAIRPGGRLVLIDYVGPSHLQYSPEVCAYAQECLEYLPERYRKTRDGVLREIKPVSIEYFEKRDPSEAVRSAEILPLIEERFEVVEKFDVGGTIIMPVLQHLLGNFSDDEESCSLVRRIFERERDLIQSGKIPSYSVAAVYAKR